MVQVNPLQSGSIAAALWTSEGEQVSHVNLLHRGAELLVVIFLSVPVEDRRCAFALAFFFHVDSEERSLPDRQPFHSDGLERQINQQELGLRLVGTPALGANAVHDEQTKALTLGLIGGEGRGYLDISETQKTVVRVGDAEPVFILVGHGILAAAGNDKIIHAVAIEIASKLRRAAQQRAIIAKLFVDVFIGYRRRRRLGMSRGRRRLFLFGRERCRGGGDRQQDKQNASGENSAGRHAPTLVPFCVGEYSHTGWQVTKVPTTCPNVPIPRA